LGALLDPDRDLAQYGRVVPTNSSNVVSIAVHDPERPEFPQITLIFVTKPSAPGGLELASWVSLDSQNNRTTIRLRNHRYGVTIPDSAFRYRDPRPSSRRPR
jgi:outer membrane lipoprotein-sorting protein